MWVLPREDSKAERLMYTIVDSLEFLKLEKFYYSITSAFLSTLVSSQSEITENWRIRIESPDCSLLLAVSDTEEGIMKKWTFLCNVVRELLIDMEREEDKIKYLKDKVAGLAQMQEGQGGEEEEAYIEKFRRDFPQLSKEKFIKCSDDCWWWDKSDLVPKSGLLYLTDRSMVFASINSTYQRSMFHPVFDFQFFYFF